MPSYGAAAKKSIGNRQSKFSKPVTTINLDGKNGKNSRHSSRASSKNRGSEGRFGSDIRMREQDQIIEPASIKQQWGKNSTANRKKEYENDSDSTSMYSASGRKITKPLSMYKSNLDRQVTNVDVNEGMPVVGCMPGC